MPAYVRLHAAAQIQIERHLEAGALLIPLPMPGPFLLLQRVVVPPATATGDLLADRGEPATEALGDVPT